MMKKSWVKSSHFHDFHSLSFNWPAFVKRTVVDFDDCTKYLPVIFRWHHKHFIDTCFMMICVWSLDSESFRFDHQTNEKAYEKCFSRYFIFAEKKRDKKSFFELFVSWLKHEFHSLQRMFRRFVNRIQPFLTCIWKVCL